MYKEIVSYYGIYNQVNVTIEEMSELIQSICKHRRDGKSNIEEELADCYIMLKQMDVIFGNCKVKSDGDFFGEHDLMTETIKACSMLVIHLSTFLEMLNEMNMTDAKYIQYCNTMMDLIARIQYQKSVVTGRLKQVYRMLDIESAQMYHLAKKYKLERIERIMEMKQ